MAHYLFPALEPESTTPIHRRDFACFLTEISRASTDAVEALTLFDHLVRRDGSNVDGLGFMAFDAHCGDTGCHLRAGMLEEYASRMQKDPSRYIWWLFPVINSLTRTQQKAQELCSKLTQESMPLRKLGLDDRHETTQSILLKLSWCEAEQYEALDLEVLQVEHRRFDFCPSDPSSAATSPGSSRNSSASPDSRASPLFSHSSLASSIESLEAPLQQCKWPIKTAWKMDDPRVMIRFIVYGFILSKYKKFHRSQDGGSARLLPRAALNFGNSLMTPFRNFKHEWSRPGNVRRVELEFRRLQSWMTDLSCAWLRYLDKQSNSMGSLIARTILLSPRGLKVAACFPAFLVLRKHLAMENLTVLLIDRHMCPTGLHHNVIRAEVALDASDASYCRPRAEWNLTRLKHTPEKNSDTRPSICILGSSVEGSHFAFQERALHNVELHDCECEENEAHVAKVLSTDADRLVTALFALHSLYPFTLECSGGEKAFFKDCLNDHPDVETAYRRSRCEAVRLGVSEDDISNFRPEHVFLETEARLFSRLSDWTPDAELLPLSDGLIAREFVDGL